MTTNAPLYFVCSRCPSACGDAFIVSALGELTAHLRDYHRIFPKSLFESIPLDEALGLACWKCGGPCDDRFDGLCGWCFTARYGD